MKKKILIALFTTSWLMPFLNANEEKRSSLYYMKLGAVHPPGNSSDILPNFGLGARFQTGYYGFDLSASLGSIAFINYASLSGTFLFYPQPEKTNQLYFGIGPGVGYYFDSVPMGQPFGSGSSQRGIVTVDGVLGYEFRHNNHLKTFIQLELSQPAVSFGGHGYHRDHTPGVAMSIGIGF